MEGLEGFIDYMRYERSVSSHTFVAYRRDLEQFYQYMVETYGECDPMKVTHKEVREWVAELRKEEGDAATTVNRKLSALRSFFKYLKRGNPKMANPMSVVRALKTKRRIPTFLSKEEQEKMFCSDIDYENYEIFRDFLVLETFYSLGLRLSELVNLKDSDVDGDRKVVRILGKGNKHREIPLADGFVELLGKFGKCKEKEFGWKGERLFLDMKGNPIKRHTVYHLIRKKLSDEGVVGKKSPHVIRHTFATTMLNSGAELESVRNLLGHSSLAATEVYTHTNFEQMKLIYKKAHPRAEKD